MARVNPVAQYPEWMYYPPSDRPAAWAQEFVEVVSAARANIDSAAAGHLTSDEVLRHLKPGLEAIGYVVEAGKGRAQKVRRPVLFGEHGGELVAYEVDAVHEALGIIVEIEAGRGARGNAVYRDLIRASLIVGADFLALGVMSSYRHLSGGREMQVASYREAKSQMDAIYASGRLTLPFHGMLLFGY